MPGGRPSKYTPELIEAAKQYIVDYEKHDHAIPSIAGLAVVLGVSRDTLHTWGNDEEKPEFSDILANLLSRQEQILVSKGLKGDFNSAITKLVLGKHGYSDKTENDNRHTVEIIELKSF